MKHKHAELIHAWADGAEIEYQPIHSTTWIDVEDPVWAKDTMYRIKPAKKVVRWQWIWKNAFGRTYVAPDMLTEQEIRNHPNNQHCLGKAEWTRMEFDN